MYMSYVKTIIAYNKCIHVYWLIRATAKNGLWGVGPRHNSQKSPNELYKKQSSKQDRKSVV